MQIKTPEAYEKAIKLLDKLCDAIYEYESTAPEFEEFNRELESITEEDAIRFLKQESPNV